MVLEIVLPESCSGTVWILRTYGTMDRNICARCVRRELCCLCILVVHFLVVVFTDSQLDTVVASLPVDGSMNN